MPKRAPYTWRQPEFPGDGSDLFWQSPTLLVICQNADVETAIQPLLRSLKQPFAPGMVASIFVHETMRDAFCERMRSRMEQMHHQAASHFNYLKAVQMVDCLKAEVVSQLTPDDINFRFKMTPGSPVIVCEFNQSFFGGSKPSALVTLHTFRYASELPRLLANERVPFASAAVWGHKMATVYEAALHLDLTVVYINCQGITISPIVEFLDAHQTHVVLAKFHHFEVISHGGKYRIIIYPAMVIWEPPNRQSAGVEETSTEEVAGSIMSQTPKSSEILLPKTNIKVLRF
ncbi:uncharacterized protein LOC108110127 [Drosophila eugracilis]|uniref:uncharacterized protein LOC108110127 n=1 Tax=Drosophila eugracilis TaxID=29029 RepID=UPI0007E838E8|nr:uncharacterized protein LOC108110127 [Drosophila eugracilis]